MTSLPIHSVLAEIKSQLSRRANNTNNAVLIAPPGAGKTTVVPLALLNEPWLEGRRIMMLEPRRLAAKNAATWMAKQLGESVGETVGYRMRLDTCVSKKTKIEVVTEGILTRIVQNDIALDNYGLVIFDEFHERSLNADLGLALTLDVQRQLRESLRILVMSATLDGESVAGILGDAPVIKSEGRGFPIEIKYATQSGFSQIIPAVVSCVLQALKNDSGSILVFLPGMVEIHRVHGQLQSAIAGAGVSIYPLYSNLPQADQEKAIEPCVKGKINGKGSVERKIVLATSIAETSLTIDGVRVVIDAGLVRQPSFDPRSSLTMLNTVRVSKASADQRAGRAGRTEPGICYRLWTKAEHVGLIAQNQVEIMQADLSSFVLELAQWGVTEANQLPWLDEPPVSSFSQAKNLLRSLDAIDKGGNVTAQGLAMMKLALHPRLAHMILKSHVLGIGALACDVAAILNERDFFRFNRGEFNADLSARVKILRAPKISAQIDAVTKKRILKNANDLRKHIGVSIVGRSQSEPLPLEKIGIALAFAYPDRIAKCRKGNVGRYQLSSGIGAQIPLEESLSNSDYLVVANLRNSNQRDDNNEARIHLAVEISFNQIEKYLSSQIEEVDSVEWDDALGAVVSYKITRLGKLVFTSKVLMNPDSEKVSQALLKGIRATGIDCLPWTKQTKLWQQRLCFLTQACPEQDWPDVSDAYLLETLENWLLPYLIRASRLTHLAKLNLTEILSGKLEWKKQQLMDMLAPCRYKVPSGSFIDIKYEKNDAPMLAVRIQELFGMEQTPAINNGRTPLVLSLLSPAKRSIQITKDLPNFWDNTYVEVKKDLKGRYPKHYWPDNPRAAVATKRTKKFM